MKRLFFILVLGMAVFTGIMIIKQKQAACAWCYSGECISNSICGQCVCAKVGGETFGRCVSFGRIDNGLEGIQR